MLGRVHSLIGFSFEYLFANSSAIFPRTTISLGKPCDIRNILMALNKIWDPPLAMYLLM